MKDLYYVFEKKTGYNEFINSIKSDDATSMGLCEGIDENLPLFCWKVSINI
jgi:hypothetical protein